MILYRSTDTYLYYKAALEDGFLRHFRNGGREKIEAGDLGPTAKFYKRIRIERKHDTVRMYTIVIAFPTSLNRTLCRTAERKSSPDP